MLVLVCGALLALALAYILFSSGPFPDFFLELFRGQLGPQQIAWTLIVVVALIVVASALWMNEKLVQQRSATELLESRLRVEEAQKDVDRAMNQLVRTVPDATVRELQQRLSNAEKELAAQQRRSDASETQALIEEIRSRQDALKENLGEAITKRKSIDQLFVTYDVTQRDIERILSGIETDEKGDSLESRIRNLSQFAKITESRFQEIEQSKQVLLELGKEFEGRQARLQPLKDDRSGVKALLHQFNDACAQLVANIETLEGTRRDIERTLSGIEADQKGDSLDTRIRDLSQFTKVTESRFQEIEQSKQMLLDLAKEFEARQARLQPLKDDRSGVKALLHRLNDACAQLLASIETLEGTRHDIERTLSGIEADQKGDSLDTRIRNLSQFTKVTESRSHEIEQSKQTLLDLRNEFDALQARLLPLKDDRSGVKALIHQLNDACAQLVASLETLERDGDLSLPERVKRIAESRRELSERVSSIAEELSKLDSSHKDINSLFAKLSQELKARHPSGTEGG